MNNRKNKIYEPQSGNIKSSFPRAKALAIMPSLRKLPKYPHKDFKHWLEREKLMNINARLELALKLLRQRFNIQKGQILLIDDFEPSNLGNWAILLYHETYERISSSALIYTRFMEIKALGGLNND